MASTVVSALLLLAAVAGSGAEPESGVYPLPDSKACARDARAVCDRVIRVMWCRGCELQCIATRPPVVSRACRTSHPCSFAVLQFCAPALRHAAPAGKELAVLACLKQHVDQLSEECRETDPCLAGDHAQCYSKGALLPLHHHYGAGEGAFAEEGSSPPCACADACGEHLDDLMCEPCGPTCVRNPRCGAGHAFCRVSSPDKCDDPTARWAGSCQGPYPRHPDCGAAMGGTLDADDNSDDRCRVQAMLAERGVCPDPRLSELHQPAWFGGGGGGGAKIRECKPPPRTHSFVRRMRAEDATRRAPGGDPERDLSPPGVGVGGNLAAQHSGHRRVVARQGDSAHRPAPPAAAHVPAGAVAGGEKASASSSAAAGMNGAVIVLVVAVMLESTGSLFL